MKRCPNELCFLVQFEPLENWFERCHLVRSEKRFFLSNETTKRFGQVQLAIFPRENTNGLQGKALWKHAYAAGRRIFVCVAGTEESWNKTDCAGMY